MPSILDDCDDSCGWIAALVAALAYGSFGVPIKETIHIDVHPLVLQSYKTGTMFLSCWFVILMGVPVRVTPWGLLSGLLWVLGGCGGIYGIRMAGMAVAVGIWASVMIATNFFWGILVFQEPTKHFWGTVGAFLFTTGLVGMSHYSVNDNVHVHEHVDIPQDKQGGTDYDEPETNRTSSSMAVNKRSPDVKLRRSYSDGSETLDKSQNTDRHVGEQSDGLKSIVLFGKELTKRQAGIVGAVINGLLTGSSLVPMHYAKKQGLGGATYMISMATGSLVANTLLWVAFFIWLRIRHSSQTLWQTYSSLPSWHFQQLWAPGFVAGLLLTISMFGSIIATTYLGQGIGNSVVQSKIIISGLWGIFWYHEITGRAQISKWFLAAAFSLCGILWLSYERRASTI